MNPKEYIEKQLKKLTGQKEVVIEVPPDPDMGDFAFPCFSLSKELKKSPIEIAEDLAKDFELKPPLKEVKIIGPYLNFFVDKSSLSEEVITKVLKDKYKYGLGSKKKEKIMVEYSSPNTNKAQHLGHVRNNLLGMALSNILEYSGYKVIRSCLMNDRGMGVSKAMLAYMKWGKDKEPNKKPDHFVADFYVKFNQEVQKYPELEEDAKELLIRWEKKDKSIIALWKKMQKWVYKGYDETYKRLGCTFDQTYYESELYTHGKDIIMDGFKKKVFIKDEGAIIADLEKYKLPKKVLIKSDGTALYMTQDIFLAKKKFDDFKMDKSIYVVGNEQNLHFRQLFKVLELLKFPYAKSCYHMSYGMINLPSGKMKSREGTTVDADNIMDDMKHLAELEVKNREKVDKKELEKRADMISLGALKFFVLMHDHQKDFTFNPEESISFEGETGPYVQYAHARICSILRKAKTLPKKADLSVLTNALEIRLAEDLKKFPEVIENISESYKVSLLARYLLTLAQDFNEFYHSCPIIKAEADQKDARLMLIQAIKQVLELGLGLLGIDAPERM